MLFRDFRTPQGCRVCSLLFAAFGLLIVFGCVACATAVRPDYEDVLAQQPERFADFLTAEPGSPQAEAVERFVMTPAGKDWLLVAYCEEVMNQDSSALSAWGELDDRRLAHWVLFWVDDDQMTLMSYVNIPNRSFRGGGSGWRISEPKIFHTLQELLVRVGYDRHPYPYCSDIRVSVVSETELGEGRFERLRLRSDSWVSHVLVAENYRAAKR